VERSHRPDDHTPSREAQEVYPGLWRIRFGQPEPYTPVARRLIPPAEAALQELDRGQTPSFPLGAITASHNHRGTQLRIDLDAREQLYGLGLQLRSFAQRGKKKTLRVNSDPSVDLGDSHAPVPFFVSTNGYGVLVDTARYATFYMGSTVPIDRGETGEEPGGIKLSSEERYGAGDPGQRSEVVVEIPFALGVDVYIFAGPTMRQSVQRYNLFSGGGALPPRWGLGIWYRCRNDFAQEQVMAIAREFRQSQIPCDVIGLEPGWQSHCYPCSYVWNETFPKPREMIQSLGQMNYRVNLWTHAFIHTSSPIYEPLREYSGPYKVFDGLVPDLTIPQARTVFADHHESHHVDLGVSGYKLDECDNSDFIASPWSFPEFGEFPSGLDGEQMHNAIGIHYQYTLEEVFRRRNQRTYGQVRNSHALASRSPFVLYSDLYDHSDYIRGLVNAGFCGLLWMPEVRHAVSDEDLIRRLQTAMLSPLAQIDTWYMANPPWKQWRREENNRNEFLPNHKELEARCRKILQLRMRLVPYLYSAFVDYHRWGLPPFRALVMDWPDDENVWTIDDQYMMGDRIMVAPLTAETSRRQIYLPAGRWWDFWTAERIDGPRRIERDVPLEEIPMYVKDNALVPLAEPTVHQGDPRSAELTVRVYGNGQLGITLYEDDGLTWDVETQCWPECRLSWDPHTATGQKTTTGPMAVNPWHVRQWQRVDPA